MNENLRHYVYFLMERNTYNWRCDELNQIYKTLRDILYSGRDYDPTKLYRYVSKTYPDIPTFEQFVRETIISLISDTDF